jgi:uroporphyrinogen-III synthase
MKKRLFISKALNELTLLPSYCQHNKIDLVAASFIRFEPISFATQRDYDILFFGSIRAAEFFLAQSSIPPSVKLSCIGSTTAEKLRALGLQVDFVGDKSGLPETVAESFVNWVGHRKVLIPCSAQSKRTIAKEFPEDQVEEIHVYRTISKCTDIQPCDIWVFTSPSNVNSFLSCNPAPQGTIIAWGATTEKALNEHGITVSQTMEVANETELVAILNSL